MPQNGQGTQITFFTRIKCGHDHVFRCCSNENLFATDGLVSSRATHLMWLKRAFFSATKSLRSQHRCRLLGFGEFAKRETSMLDSEEMYVNEATPLAPRRYCFSAFLFVFASRDDITMTIRSIAM